MTNWWPCGPVIGALLRQFHAKCMPNQSRRQYNLAGVYLARLTCDAATHATFFRFMRADWSTTAAPQSFSGKNRPQGMAFVLPVSRTSVPCPPQGGFRGEERETQFILPAHTDPIRFTADPGSDTIARG